MPSLSLALIVRDEEQSLGAILGDAQGFCDELVVVDTGSTDNSRQVAVECGARVLDFTWIDDFAAARNAAFDACTSDWIIWLDADDRIPLEVQARFRQIKAELTDDLDGVFLPYRYHFLPGTDVCTYWLYRERLIRRAAGLRWEGRVHEVLSIPAGRSVVRDDVFVEHRPSQTKTASRIGRNLRILRAAVEDGDRSPRTMYYLGNELRDYGDYADALDAYSEYFENPGADWEQYACRVSMAQCCRQLGKREDAIDNLLAAMKTDASRAEAYLRLAEIYYDEQNWSAAIPLLTAATAIARPSMGFVNEPDYSWLPWDYLGVCFANVGRYDESIDAARRSLREGNPQAERVRGNIVWATQQL